MGKARVFKIAALIAAILVLCGAADMSDEDFLRQLYTDYLKLLTREQGRPYSRILRDVEGVLTPTFAATIRQSQEQLDADPILDAQDYSSDWSGHIAVSRDGASQEGARYLVCMGVPGGMRHALVASVMRHDGRLLLGGARIADPARCRP